MTESLASVGLTMQRDKCEIVPAAGINHGVDLDSFSGFLFNASGNFKLLGAPFGSPLFCAEHTQKRRKKAEELLKKVSAMEDAQSSLHLIRNCVSFCKLVYSARTVPPDLHRSVLLEFSGDLRAALTEVAGASLDERAWEQAKLRSKNGGLGIRGPEDHCSAAYLASLMECKQLCQ